MELGEFIETTSRAEKYFDKEYTTEQSKIMFEELKKLSVETYRKAMASCIRNCKYLPKLTDIFQSIKDSTMVGYKEETEYENCPICDSRGVIRTIRLLNNGGDFLKYDEICRCTCANAKNYSAKIPTFFELGIDPYNL